MTLGNASIFLPFCPPYCVGLGSKRSRVWPTLGNCLFELSLNQS